MKFLNKINELNQLNLAKNILLLKEEIENSWLENDKQTLKLGINVLEMLNNDFYDVTGVYFIAKEIIFYYNNLWRLKK